MILKKSENIHKVHQYVVHQTTQCETKTKNLKSELQNYRITIEQYPHARFVFVNASWPDRTRTSISLI